MSVGSESRFRVTLESVLLCHENWVTSVRWQLPTYIGELVFFVEPWFWSVFVVPRWQWSRRQTFLCLSSHRNCFRCIRIVPFSNNNNNIYIAPGRISVKWKSGWINSFMSRIKNRQRVADQNCLWQRVPDRWCWRLESTPGKVCPNERLEQLFDVVSGALE